MTGCNCLRNRRHSVQSCLPTHSRYRICLRNSISKRLISVSSMPDTVAQVSFLYGLSCRYLSAAIKLPITAFWKGISPFTGFRSGCGSLYTSRSASAIVSGGRRVYRRMCKSHMFRRQTSRGTAPTSWAVGVAPLAHWRTTRGSKNQTRKKFCSSQSLLDITQLLHPTTSMSSCRPTALFASTISIALAYREAEDSVRRERILLVDREAIYCIAFNYSLVLHLHSLVSFIPPLRSNLTWFSKSLKTFNTILQARIKHQVRFHRIVFDTETLESIHRMKHKWLQLNAKVQISLW